MLGTQPTLRGLAGQTAALQRRLLELLATYPEEHLSGHEQYLSRIFSIYWRHEEIASKEPYDPSDKRYWDCVMWVRWFEDYIVELEALLALVELTPQRLALLPLRSKVSEPAMRVAELLGTQAEVLQSWVAEAEEKATEAEAEKERATADFWRGLRRDFEDLARSGDFKLLWRSSPARSLITGVPVTDSRWTWPRSVDADQRIRFIATALRGAKALGGPSEELWLDTIRLSFEHDRTGVHGNDQTVTIEDVLKRSISLCFRFEANFGTPASGATWTSAPAPEPAAPRRSRADRSVLRKKWLAEKLEGRCSLVQLSARGCVAYNTLRKFLEGGDIKETSRRGIVEALVSLGLECEFSELPD